MTSPLLNMTTQQWESLCDGCGRCCLVKLEDEETGDLHYTNVACKFLDSRTCRCTDYANRAAVQPDCMVLGPERLDVLRLMPWTCAYRLVEEGRVLAQDPSTLPVSGRVVSEDYVHEEQLEDQVIDWVANHEHQAT